MRTQFTTLDPDFDLEEAAEVMSRSAHWLLPVCIGPKLVGSLSLLDMVTYGRANEGQHGTQRVADAMTREPFRCAMETSLKDVRSLICRHRQPAICVTSSDGDLVGMIDAFEVIEALTAPQAFSGPEPEQVRQVRGDA
ncbi:CBS domain-containing protein [Thiocystis violacea]|uniref:CBS domain-containing protein n=1 Tax=Thiocystis violacea TaxID=13725 RepID=UPI001908FD93|nr:CBS domain-containing protein [Thiocystis violacea]